MNQHCCIILIDFLIQRYEARFENIHAGEDGERLCTTAPHGFYGMHFDRPLTCFTVSPLLLLSFLFPSEFEYGSQSRWGTYGVWEVDSNDC